METMQDSGGLFDGSRGSVAPGLSISKTANQLKIVESGNESDKLLTATKSMQMDPYKELELYLAKVNNTESSYFEHLAKDFKTRSDVTNDPLGVQLFRSSWAHWPNKNFSRAARRLHHFFISSMQPVLKQLFEEDALRGEMVREKSTIDELDFLKLLFA
ncbi:hypothetical protein WN51_10132 [Melipona quadrifasciata]|uniref:Uncharacterized protein n=1 Tax=Melipona quadrifasciata TaxID=166423 RepID=A0A0M9A7T1_9HYME|nr:hypothetical protein WN51_10132 [Melipona quadrifasciata]